MAWTDCAWADKNWSRGSGDSHALRRSNFFEKVSLKIMKTGGGFRTMTCGRCWCPISPGGGVAAIVGFQEESRVREAKLKENEGLQI